MWEIRSDVLMCQSNASNVICTHQTKSEKTAVPITRENHALIEGEEAFHPIGIVFHDRKKTSWRVDSFGDGELGGRMDMMVVGGRKINHGRI